MALLPYSSVQLRPEFEAYVTWLADLACQSQQRMGMPFSRHYIARGLNVYTRYGKAFVEGVPCVYLCLSSIELSERRRSRGFFGHLVEHLCKAASPLSAQSAGVLAAPPFDVLTVESVSQEPLAKWLLTKGFRKYSGLEDSYFGNYARWIEPVPVARDASPSAVPTG